LRGDCNVAGGGITRRGDGYLGGGGASWRLGQGVRACLGIDEEMLMWGWSGCWVGAYYVFFYA